jgi:hypothetical protein
MCTFFKILRSQEINFNCFTRQEVRPAHGQNLNLKGGGQNLKKKNNWEAKNKFCKEDNHKNIYFADFF